MSDLLRQRPAGPAALRQLLNTAIEQRAPLIAPGCYDALGARLIEQAGFDAAYMTGFGTTASPYQYLSTSIIHTGKSLKNASQTPQSTILDRILYALKNVKN